MAQQQSRRESRPEPPIDLQLVAHLKAIEQHTKRIATGMHWFEVLSVFAILGWVLTCAVT